MTLEELITRIKSPGFNMAISGAATNWDYSNGHVDGEMHGEPTGSRGDYITAEAIAYLLDE